MAIGAKELNLQNEAPDNRRAVPTLGGGAKVAAALEHAVKAAPPVHAGGFFFAHAYGALCEADKKGDELVRGRIRPMPAQSMFRRRWPKWQRF